MKTGLVQHISYRIMHAHVATVCDLIIAICMHDLKFVHIKVLINICDRAREKGPSGHIKFDHIFQLC